MRITGSETVVKLLLYIVLTATLVIVIFMVSMFYESDSYYNFKCMLKSGEVANNASNNFFNKKICRIKTKDYGVICSDNQDCDGVCVIDGAEALRGRGIDVFEKNYFNISLDEFERRTMENVTGECSEYKYDTKSEIDRCSKNSAIYVENGIVKLNNKPINFISCDEFKP